LAFFPDNGAAFVGRGSAIIPPSRLMIASPPQAASVSFSSASASAGGFLSEEMIAKLAKNDWVEIRDFISPELVSELRGDVEALRNRDGRFKQAGVGQDATNTLNTKIRRAETCFIYPKQPIADAGQPQSRQKLYDLLDGVGERLSEHSALGPNAPKLDARLHEALYAFYPQGGFYRRHQDAVAGSASVLRAYSFLLYLNDGAWDAEKDKGQLRLHFDSGGDYLPEGEAPSFLDVAPHGGTMVLFRSEKVPHEVLDTTTERTAVVGWYNRGVSLADVSALSGGGVGGGNTLQVAMLAVAAGLVTTGLINIVGQL
jgi:SM-20-related protein